MDEHYAFGDVTWGWVDPRVTGAAQTVDLPSAIAWLDDGHARLHARIATLTDDEVAVPRRTTWGERKETGWIITTLIEHDIYHAGEINHLRSLHDGDDRWAYERRPEQCA